VVVVVTTRTPPRPCPRPRDSGGIHARRLRGVRTSRLRTDVIVAIGQTYDDPAVDRGSEIGQVQVKVRAQTVGKG
jgi:hypothetical protein